MESYNGSREADSRKPKSNRISSILMRALPICRIVAHLEPYTFFLSKEFSL